LVPCGATIWLESEAAGIQHKSSLPWAWLEPYCPSNSVQSVV
jgi:hypothetical protein